MDGGVRAYVVYQPPRVPDTQRIQTLRGYSRSCGAGRSCFLDGAIGFVVNHRASVIKCSEPSKIRLFFDHSTCCTTRQNVNVGRHRGRTPAYLKLANDARFDGRHFARWSLFTPTS